MNPPIEMTACKQCGQPAWRQDVSGNWCIEHWRERPQVCAACAQAISEGRAVPCTCLLALPRVS